MSEHTDRKTIKIREDLHHALKTRAAVDRDGLEKLTDRILERWLTRKMKEALGGEQLTEGQDAGDTTRSDVRETDPSTTA